MTAFDYEAAYRALATKCRDMAKIARMDYSPAILQGCAIGAEALAEELEAKEQCAANGVGVVRASWLPPRNDLVADSSLAQLLSTFRPDWLDRSTEEA